jgi:hypothetical protein
MATLCRGHLRLGSCNLRLYIQLRNVRYRSISFPLQEPAFAVGTRHRPPLASNRLRKDESFRRCGFLALTRVQSAFLLRHLSRTSGEGGLLLDCPYEPGAKATMSASVVACHGAERNLIQVWVKTILRLSEKTRRAIMLVKGACLFDA